MKPITRKLYNPYNSLMELRSTATNAIVGINNTLFNVISNGGFLFKWITLNPTGYQPNANAFITFRVKYKFGVRNTTSTVTAPGINTLL